MTATLIFFGNLVLFAASGLFFLVLAVSSVREGAFRAGIIAFFFLAANTLFWLLVIKTAPLWLNLGILGLAGGIIVLSCIRFFPDPIPPRDVHIRLPLHQTRYPGAPPGPVLYQQKQRKPADCSFYG